MPITKHFNRTKITFPIDDPNKLLTLARKKYDEKNYEMSFDLYESLADNFPGNGFEILAEVYDKYQSLKDKDRYSLYQSRFFNFNNISGNKIIDIGSGHNPFPFATYLSDISLTDHKYGRGGVPFKEVNGKPSYEFNVEDIPFADKEFDFVYCSHVLEHTLNPAKACREIMRIGKRGYIETPVRAKDLFFNTAKVSNHNWKTEVLGDTLIFRKYSDAEQTGICNNALLDLSCSPLTDREKSINALVQLKANHFNNMFCWENDFKYKVLDENGNEIKEKREQVAVSFPQNTERKVKFSFIMIVLNGMPFIECSLNSIYNFAHEIIIIEGAVKNCLFAAKEDGSSTDGTAEYIKSFPDPEKKIKIVQGLWPEKLEMHNRALEFVTGDYVWIIDSDEVYRNEDLEKVSNLIKKDDSITQINVIPDNFWRGFKYTFVSQKFFEEPHHTRRVFKFKKGSRFTTHRPPTLVWPGSEQSTEQMNLIDGLTSRYLGIRMFHYSYVLDKQVMQKIILYKKYGWDKMWGIDFDSWYNDFFLEWTETNRTELEKKFPVWTGDLESYTVEFTETHPEAVIEFLKKFQAPDETAPDVMMKYVIECIYGLKRQFPYIKAIETGTIRSFHEKHESTRYISEALGSHGDLTSVDIEPSSINISRQICKDASNVNWVLSDSKKYLSSLKVEVYHFALLDSVNDKDHIFEEFRLILPRMHNDGIIVIDDAGITSSGAAIDIQVAAQKGHMVWEYLNFCKISYEVKVTPHGHGTQIILQLNDEKRKKLINSFNAFGNKASEKKNVKIAGHCEKEKSLTQIDSVSEFAQEIKKVISEYKPLKIIETGTFQGTGTTTIIASALKELNLNSTKFFSIEVNVQNYNEAVRNLKAACLDDYVTLLHGLSVPKKILPSIEEIENKTVKQIEYDDIFVDHQEEYRAKLYFNETNFNDVEDDLIEQCLVSFEYEPDFVLLDSGGHIGNIEFNYLIEKLNKTCIIALDDINHIKHKKSFMQINSDPRFQLITSSDEKFGFCVAKFTPSEIKSKPVKKGMPYAENILFIRTDSIGDNILASSMLKHIKNKFRNASLTVLCQEHIAVLYKNCPFVNDVITIDKKRIYVDEQYKSEVIAEVQQKKFDLVINTVISSEKITDLLSFTAGAQNIIRIDGNAVNSSQDWVNEAKNMASYCVNTGAGKVSEIKRYEKFIKGIGCDNAVIEPCMWLDNHDERYAEEFFNCNNLDPDKTIVLFAGAQNDHRLYYHYGKTLSEICSANGMSVIAIGDEKDYSINQKNLDDINVPCKFNLSGKTTILQAAAIIKKCRLAVGAETGNAHICCAVGTPNVILLGGGHYGRFMPYSNLTSLVTLPLECFGCNWRCSLPSFKCVDDISPNTIRKAVEDTLIKASQKTRVFVQNENPGSFSILNKFLERDSFAVISCSDNQLLNAEAMILNEQYAAATDLLIKILEKTPGNTDALNNLAVAQSMLGNNEIARKTLDLVLSLDPSNEITKENMKIIYN